MCNLQINTADNYQYQPSPFYKADDRLKNLTVESLPEILHDLFDVIDAEVFKEEYWNILTAAMSDEGFAEMESDNLSNMVFRWRFVSQKLRELEALSHLLEENFVEQLKKEA